MSEAGLGEFGRIRRFFAPLAGPGGLGLKDDAALVDCRPGHRLVVTVDAIVEGVHYLPEDPPDLVARKLLRVNLSDLAAMGARRPPDPSARRPRGADPALRAARTTHRAGPASRRHRACDARRLGWAHRRSRPYLRRVRDRRHDRATVAAAVPGGAAGGRRRAGSAGAPRC